MLEQARFSIKNSQIFSNIMATDGNSYSKQDVKLDQIMTQNDELFNASARSKIEMQQSQGKRANMRNSEDDLKPLQDSDGLNETQTT